MYHLSINQSIRPDTTAFSAIPVDTNNYPTPTT
jgi:hypothetical protein